MIAHCAGSDEYDDFTCDLTAPCKTDADCYINDASPFYNTCIKYDTCDGDNDEGAVKYCASVDDTNNFTCEHCAPCKMDAGFQ